MEKDIIANRLTSWCATLGVAALMTGFAGAVCAQTRIEQGFNLFSLEQDQEIGRQSAAEAESQLPILHDRSIEAYVGKIGERLAAVAPGGKYPYQFRIVNEADINAFALPGGYLYLNRGLIEAARNEGQLAGVMAHEMAHVALRHGTSQASKAYLGQAGLGLLAGIIGKDDHSTDDTIAAVGGFGMNTVFLKFSRAAEEQADITGAQMMAAAGYDPADMVDFFEFLAEQQDRNPGKVAQFFSSHPASADRADRINNEIRLLTVRPIRPVGGFAGVQAELMRMRPAESLQEISRGTTEPTPVQRSGRRERQVADYRPDSPSEEFRTFVQRDGLFQIEFPDNWQIYEADHGYGVTIAPNGGFVDTGGRERDLISGVIVNHYDSLEDDASDRFSNGRDRIDGSTDLIRATNDLVDRILRINSDMRMLDDSERRDRIDGAPSLSVVLFGRSPVTGQEERITVFTREIPDNHIIYALFVAPQQDYDDLNRTFNRMISSLQVSDRETHSSGNATRSSTTVATVPSGTVLMVSFLETLSSESSQAGDRFTAQIVEPVLLAGRVAIAEGSTISGRVVDVQPAKRFGGRALLSLEFTSLRLRSGVQSPISASFHGQAESESKDAVLIGGAAAGGAVLGHVLGDDDEDAVLGAILGGAIGTGIAARNRGEQVTLPEGLVVEIHLDAPFNPRISSQ